MAYHVVFSAPVDLAAIRAGAAADRNPGHANGAVAAALGARVHDGAGLAPSLADRVRGKLFGQSGLAWAIAGRVRTQAAPGDVIFCAGEDVGLPVAAVCGGRARVALMVHNLDRPRMRLALRLLGIRRRASLFFAVAAPQTRFLRSFVRGEADRVLPIVDQTDLAFFTPGPPRADKPRPIVASVGLEQRDYRTLAAATAALDVDVRISGFSRDATAIARAFPAALPANMDRRFYEWPELRQLYRDADVVVVSVAPNRYAAGIQVMMEAMACARPVVVTRSEGLAEEIEAAGDAVTLVPCGDPAAMGRAIEALLADRARAERQGQLAGEIARSRYSTERYVGRIVDALRTLAAR